VGRKDIYKDATNGFKKGQSGNPNGRPKKTMTNILNELLNSNKIEIELVINGETKDIDITTKQGINTAIAAKLIEKALQGDLGAIKEINDRTEGKAKEQDTTEIKEQPINITIKVKE
jgi:hypothetical protein